MLKIFDILIKLKEYNSMCVKIRKINVKILYNSRAETLFVLRDNAIYKMVAYRDNLN